MDRASFLEKVLAYGHLDLLDTQRLRFLSRQEFCEYLRPDNPPEAWLADILKDSSDTDVKIAMETEPVFEACYQRLFYSEPTVFQRYIKGSELPLLDSELQMRTFMITDLPESLLELKPRRFWKLWVSTLIMATD
jgi:hypothetical protein